MNWKVADVEFQRFRRASESRGNGGDFVEPEEEEKD